MGESISNISAWLSTLTMSEAIAFLTALVTVMALLNRLLKATIRTMELVTKLVNKLMRLWRPRAQRKTSRYNRMNSDVTQARTNRKDKT